MLDKDNKKNEDIILPLVKKEGLENVNDTLNDTQNQINKIFIEQNKSERFQAIFSKYEKDISDYILNFFCRIFEKEEDLIKVLNKFNSKTINNKLKYLIELFNIQTLDDFDKMICNEITIKGAILENLEYICKTFKINDLNHFITICKNIEFETILEQAKILNLEKLNELYKFTNIYELIGLTPEIKSVLKQAKINYWNNISMFSDEEKHEILQSSNIRLINLLNSFTIEAEKINLWKEFFQLFLEEPIYLTKNIENFVDNIKLINENNKHLIYEFIDKMGGLFISKYILKEYLIGDENKRENLITDYKNKIKTILSNNKITYSSNQELEFLAEAIYLAYRPLDFSQNDIFEMIRFSKTKDLSNHLDNIKFQKDGYKGVLVKTREDMSEIDPSVFNKIDKVLFDSEDTLETYLNNVSNGQIDFERLSLLILKNYPDLEFKSYLKHYNFFLGEFTFVSTGKIKKLEEIFSNILTQNKFSTYLDEVYKIYPKLEKLILQNQEQGIITKIRNFLTRNNEKLNLTNRKKRFQNDKELIRIVEDLLNPRMANNEITELIDRIKIKTPDKIYSNKFLNKIASFIIEKKLQSINLSTETKQNIKAFLLEKYKINLKNPKNILEENIKDIFRKKQSEVRKQTDKIKIENISKKREEIKFIISKNLGSFFSRSGAALCTANNIDMWKEDRYIHLNIIKDYQCIGVILLYFEKERNYLIARGFNPRIDIVRDYDVKNLTQEMVRVVKQIALENGYENVYIPYFWLSNRDKISKELKNISLQNKHKPDYKIKTYFAYQELNSESHVDGLYML